MVFLLTYAVFCLAGSYVLDVLGLRNAILLEMILASAGAWIKLGSVSPDRFWVIILGQTVVGISQVLVTPAPSRLAASWFGPKEVSTACSIAIFGGLIGTAVGFLIPPMLVKNHIDSNIVEHGMYTLALATAVLNTLVLILVYIFFKDNPLLPPSPAQLEKEQERKETDNFLQSLKSLISNSSYSIFVLSFGISSGVYYAISQLLNEIILIYYPNGAVYAGIAGLISTITGMVGAVVCGTILDRFGRFRETIIGASALTCLSMLTFTLTIDKGIMIVYIVIGLFGFFITALYLAAYEVTAELTYPIQESTSAGVMTLITQISGILFTTAYSSLLNKTGDKITNTIMSGLLGVGTVLLFLMRFELRRHAVQTQIAKPQVFIERF
ncbi:hypothetical protein ILUMI_18452 [Ignelater luminosus]|uniref:Major facilitator superfamily (MFS) profile domain-containing protein n=1 Tax=Ignelater luminosus TaxID=2038154 RepID=A0A8K0CLA4_IGNLU|nr:hypothetical protein ILUMI_18452 [Ignelater luminosus]